MKQKLINHFSGWWRDLPVNPQDYYLVMTDDMDSFYSCKMLKHLFGVEIGGFYKFGEGLYLTDKAKKNDKEAIYVDCSIAYDGVMCFDNHMTIRTNHLMINPNLILDRFDEKSYNKKYCGSTLLFLIALYGKECSTTEKLYALAIDAFYKGWYNKGGKYKDINKYWLNLFGLDDYAEILDSHSMEFFDNYIFEKQLNEKIIIDKGRLFTFADILPHDKFSLVMKTKSYKLTRDQVDKIRQSDRRIFNCAETYKGFYIANIITGGKP